jgi:hypothetical protein
LFTSTISLTSQNQIPAHRSHTLPAIRGVIAIPSPSYPCLRHETPTLDQNSVTSRMLERTAQNVFLRLLNPQFPEKRNELSMKVTWKVKHNGDIFRRWCSLRGEPSRQPFLIDAITLSLQTRRGGLIVRARLLENPKVLWSGSKGKQSGEWRLRDYSGRVGALRVLVSEISSRQPTVATPIAYERPVPLPFGRRQWFRGSLLLEGLGDPAIAAPSDEPSSTRDRTLASIAGVFTTSPNSSNDLQADRVWVGLQTHRGQHVANETKAADSTA